MSIDKIDLDSELLVDKEGNLIITDDSPVVVSGDVIPNETKTKEELKRERESLFKDIESFAKHGKGTWTIATTLTHKVVNHILKSGHGSLGPAAKLAEAIRDFDHKALYDAFVRAMSECVAVKFTPHDKIPDKIVAKRNDIKWAEIQKDDLYLKKIAQLHEGIQIFKKPKSPGGGTGKNSKTEGVMTILGRSFDRALSKLSELPGLQDKVKDIQQQILSIEGEIESLCLRYDFNDVASDLNKAKDNINRMFIRKQNAESDERINAAREARDAA